MNTGESGEVRVVKRMTESLVVGLFKVILFAQVLTGLMLTQRAAKEIW
jgi:hypothetical protein